MELAKFSGAKKSALGTKAPEEDKSFAKGGRKSYKDRMAEKKQRQEDAEDSSPTSARKSLKQRQEDKKLEKEEMEARKNVEKADPGLVQEVDCETQICGACKAVVEEFGTIIFLTQNVFG